MREPPADLKVRDVKQWYVEYLSELLGEDDQEELASPLLVISSVGKSEFRHEHLSSYTYEVQLVFPMISY